MERGVWGGNRNLKGVALSSNCRIFTLKKPKNISLSFPFFENELPAFSTISHKSKIMIEIQRGINEVTNISHLNFSHISKTPIIINFTAQSDIADYLFITRTPPTNIYLCIIVNQPSNVCTRCSILYTSTYKLASSIQ